MRAWALFLVTACSGATVTATATGTATSTATASITTAPTEPVPEHLQDHLHEPPAHFADLDKLYVEVASDGEHGDVLRQSATTGLGAVPYVSLVEAGGDVELNIELASLTLATDGTACKVKIFVMRLPQHDLLAIADAGARTSGTGATDICLTASSSAIVRQKLPPLLERQLEAKR